ncbi:hypothetical protein OIU84_003688 [Salix udensis]|uniref:Uncharacterized protein n=1 Tax=Salix udensis TaxID=889485 RepID=A0AAD6K0K9_9ROSI|nr:hypothetical protein OIU84_003688 [Salix udensis]
MFALLKRKSSKFSYNILGSLSLLTFKSQH